MVLLLMLILLGAVAFFAVVWRKRVKVSELYRNNIFLLIIIGAVVRVLSGKLFAGPHPSDMRSFLDIAGWLSSEGFSTFLSHGKKEYSTAFLYVLWFIGHIKSLFHIGDGWSAQFLVMLPNIASDIGVGVIFYSIAKKKTGAKAAFIIGLLYILNPAAIYNSAVWGAADSFHALLVVAAIYFLSRDKAYRAFILVTAAVLSRAELLPLYLIFVYYIYDLLRKNKLSSAAIQKAVMCVAFTIGAALLMVAPLMPAGIKTVWNAYAYMFTKGMSYASVNGYNIWGLVGQNWGSLDERFLNVPVWAWSNFAVAVSLVITIYILNRRKGEVSWWLAAASILTITFFACSKQHERYLFIALALWLGAYVHSLPSKANIPADTAPKRLRTAYILLSVASLFNMYDVLRSTLAQSYWDNIKGTARVYSTLAVLAFIYTCYAVYRAVYEKKQKQAYVFSVDHTESETRFKKADWIIMAVITVVYSFIAFFNVGNTVSPQSMWVSEAGDVSVIEFNENTKIHRIEVFLGYKPKRDMKIEFSYDGANWSAPRTESFDGVFRWYSRNLEVDTKFVRITTDISSDGDAGVIAFGEMAFRDDNDELIANFTVSGGEKLFDEQDIIPYDNDWMNSTYFDEVYHPRSAYEYLHDFKSGFTDNIDIYEWTHPPLGKLIMSLGVAMFGMTPFGWRFMGVLLGCFMVPVMYLLARRILKDTKWAAFATIMFTFDFMHYAQTRMATIDTYIVFFVMLMFYFMYRYYTMSFYDTPLKKTFVPLGLCGLSFGLGVACKWPGIYAGAGLAVLFGITMFKRYREYRGYLAAKRDGFAGDGAVYKEGDFAKFREYFIKTGLFCVCFFILIPLVIYTASFIPMAIVHHATSLPGFVKEFIHQQRSMWIYHSVTVANSTHAYYSRWFEWVFDLRPLFLYSHDLGVNEAGAAIKQGISTFNNPLVTLGGAACFIYGGYIMTRRNDRTWGFLLLGYAAQLVPWLLVVRGAYSYHYFPSLPFLALALGYTFKTVKALNRKWVMYTAAAAVVIVFAIYLPVLYGAKMDVAYVQKFLQLPFIGKRWNLI